MARVARATAPSELAVRLRPESTPTEAFSMITYLSASKVSVLVRAYAA
jgi:hypothetical protein